MTHTTLHYNSINHLPAVQERYQLFIQGDEQVLSWLHGMLYKRLQRFGMRITDNAFVVDTAIQDAFMQCWTMRQQMENMRHIYFFLRQHIRWSCLKFYNRPHAMHKYSPLFTAGNDEWLADPDTLDTTIAAKASATEKVRLIEAVIPYLPPSKQTMMQLYFRCGFSYKHIAKRLAITHAAAYREVESSLLFLKKMIHTQEKFSKEAFTAKPLELPELNKGEHRQLLVHRWRSVHRLSFKEIAERLQLPEAEVKSLYVQAAKAPGSRKPG